MAWNKPVTNTKPATQTDEGPYGSTRAKSADGQYTANPSFSGTEEEKEQQLQKLNSVYPQFREQDKQTMGLGYNQKSLDFDERICVPLFKALARIKIGARLGSNKFETATPYEDQKLHIDIFAGDPDPKYAFLLNDPNIETIELKTEKRYLGSPDLEEEFEKNPRINLSIRKIHARQPYKIHNQLTKGFNSHYAFNIISSPSKKQDIIKANQIDKAILFYTETGDVKSFVKDNGESVIDEFADILKGNPSDDIIEEKFSSLAQTKRITFDPPKRQKNNAVDYTIRMPLPEDNNQEVRGIFGRDRHGDWNILIDFPARSLTNKPSTKAWTFQLERKN